MRRRLLQLPFSLFWRVLSSKKKCRFGEQSQCLEIGQKYSKGTSKRDLQESSAPESQDRISLQQAENQRDQNAKTNTRGKQQAHLDHTGVPTGNNRLGIFERREEEEKVEGERETENREGCQNRFRESVTFEITTRFV